MKREPFPRSSTWGQLFDPAMKVTTQEEADEYLELLVQYYMLHEYNREEAESVARSNLGYWTGYYDAETAQRVFTLFKCTHSVFGTYRPTPQEAFSAEVELAKRMPDTPTR